MKYSLTSKFNYGIKQDDSKELNIENFYLNKIKQLAEENGYPKILADVFLSMLKIITFKNWEGSCHPTASILYVVYNELGFNVNLFLGEVKIDHRYFDHSWIEIDGLIIDASLISPINKQLGLSPVFLNINLDTSTPTSLMYGAKSSIGLSEFTEIIHKRPFHKYMNPFPWGNGKWSYVEAISDELNLNIDIKDIPRNYRNTERKLVR